MDDAISGVPNGGGPKAADVVPSYGLRSHVLSPLETLAQSISLIAPSTTPTLTVPLVFAMCGNGTSMAYLLALAAMVLIALCVASFARESASPGSLYVYVHNSLPPIFSVVAAWALFFAYIMTAASVLGGFLNFFYILFGSIGQHIPPVLLSLLGAVAAMYIAYRDIKISARLMLYIETVSVLLIGFVIAVTLWKHGLHIDAAQITLTGISAKQIRLGVMLSIFSFVGFESATTLGSEARDPLKAIPRAVIGSALLAGLFFMICAYGEVVGFRGSPITLGDSPAPFHYLSTQAGVSFVAWLIDVGVLISMFAATLACVIAASRVLLLMSHHGLTHHRLSQTSVRNETPALAGVLCALLAFLPVAVLAGRGASGADIYGWMGVLSVFGFLTAYLLAAVALAVHRKREGRLTPQALLLALIASLVMMAALLGNLFPVPPAPDRYFPYIYAGYMALALGWYGISTRRQALAAA